MPEEYVIEMKGITKVYPNGTAANQDVDFSVRKGEIHALMGENGAGKSTLMKMLFGLEQPTSGEIRVNGEKVNLTSPTVAISKGIGMVHQHFMLVPSLTVAENMVLGMVPKKSGLFIDAKKAVEITKEYSEKFNLHVDPDAKVMDIPVGMKQKVEILKALVRGARILILDEPTAVLTAQETEELFKELINLKKQGYTIIFISHKHGCPQYRRCHAGEDLPPDGRPRRHPFGTERNRLPQGGGPPGAGFGICKRVGQKNAG